VVGMSTQRRDLASGIHPQKSSLGMLRPKSSQQGCECIEWNACCLTALDRKRTKSTPCPEINQCEPRNAC
jgi:hypothetical protein